MSDVYDYDEDVLVTEKGTQLRLNTVCLATHTVGSLPHKYWRHQSLPTWWPSGSRSQVYPELAYYDGVTPSKARRVR